MHVYSFVSLISIHYINMNFFSIAQSFLPYFVSRLPFCWVDSKGSLHIYSFVHLLSIHYINLNLFSFSPEFFFLYCVFGLLFTISFIFFLTRFIQRKRMNITFFTYFIIRNKLINIFIYTMLNLFFNVVHFNLIIHCNIYLHEVDE